MVEGPDSRVDFGMAEALAFGTLALHKGVRPPQALAVAQQASAGADTRSAMQRGAGSPPPCHPLQCLIRDCRLMRHICGPFRVLAA